MIELHNNRIDRTKTSRPPILDLGGKKMLFSSAIANMHAVISFFFALRVSDFIEQNHSGRISQESWLFINSQYQIVLRNLTHNTALDNLELNFFLLTLL